MTSLFKNYYFSASTHFLFPGLSDIISPTNFCSDNDNMPSNAIIIMTSKNLYPAKEKLQRILFVGENDDLPENLNDFTLVFGNYDNYYPEYLEYFIDFYDFSNKDTPTSKDLYQSCKNMTEVFNAILSGKIPIYEGKMPGNFHFQIFNKNRIIFDHALKEKLDQDETFLNIYYSQPCFQCNAIEIAKNWKQNLRKKLQQIFLIDGYLLPEEKNNTVKSNLLPNMELHSYSPFFKQTVMSDKETEFIVNNYDPTLNGYKCLLLVAAHIDSPLKLQVVKNNLYFFQCACMDIVVGNTANLQHNSSISCFCSENNIKYFEIPNDKYIDFGKYIYLLGKVKYSCYHTIFFTNDSYIIHNPIRGFLNLAIKSPCDLYGYNDSSENIYHYQSYLFSVKRKGIAKFISLFLEHSDEIKNIKDHADVIKFYELNLINAFESRDCFLKIANLPEQKGKNIFFKNDDLYMNLALRKILPFTKLKRALQKN